MNKAQIIAPLVAMAVAVLVLALLYFRKPQDEPYLGAASLVGAELVAQTNTDHLTSISPDLRSNLLTFLRAPATFAGVRPEPIDNGHPTATVRLANDAGESFDLRLRWEKDLGKFTPVAYEYPATNRLGHLYR